MVTDFGWARFRDHSGWLPNARPCDRVLVLSVKGTVEARDMIGVLPKFDGGVASR